MAHWRDSYKPPRFFFVDAYAGVVLLSCALHVRIWTVCSAFAVMVLFWWLERLGLSAKASMRALRTWFVGDLRPARPPRMRRGRIDYDRRPMP
jgi:intracellular multiplication protein IcmT